MSILQPTSDPAATAANQVRNICRQSYNQLAISGRQGWNLIWNNPNATGSEIVTQLSTDALAVFQLATLNITTLQAAATIAGTTAPQINSLPNGVSIAFNADGTAVVTTPQPSSSSSSSASSLSSTGGK